ncbi:MAG: hypothetical protein CL930_05090 [Deltaproteobacteria bacterium]|nr:hypothetical protein [Deltaproteobacteria bacterium]
MSVDSCCEVSKALGEPVAGTAIVNTFRWLLVELPGAWAPKVMDSPALQGPVREHLDRALQGLPGSRLQLIRRPSSTGKVTVMAATSSSDNQTVYRLKLKSIEQLVDIDIAALFAGGEGSESLQESIYLVCSHGIRDQCCAREGLPVFNALHHQRPGLVWQTTHLGGHRFAATLVVLPMGLQFGRVSPDDAVDLTSSIDVRRIYRLDRYRGTTSCSRMMQVAEAHLRSEGQNLGIDSVRHLSSTDTAEIFDVHGKSVRVAVRTKSDPRMRPFSCGDEKQRSPSIHEATVSSL